MQRSLNSRRRRRRTIVDRLSARRLTTIVGGLTLLPYNGTFTREALFPALPIDRRLNVDRSASGRGVVIAFLDSGFAPLPALTTPMNRVRAHVHFEGERARLVEFGSRMGYWPTFGSEDPHVWHGSMTAGFACGQSAEGIYDGLARDAELVLVRVTNSRNQVKERDIERGLRWILNHHRRFNIRIVNASVGGDHPASLQRTPVDRLVEELTNEGVTFVAAAGNRTGPVLPPASAPSAITVGGLDDQNAKNAALWRHWPSRSGLTENGDFKPDISAPSIWLAAPLVPMTPEAEEAAFLTRILTTPDAELRVLLQEAPGRGRTWAGERVPVIRRLADLRIRELKLVNSGYQHVDGTSFAAPLVTATVAQMIESVPELTPGMVKSLLIATAQVLSNHRDTKRPLRVVNPSAALAAVRKLALRGRFGPHSES